MNACARPFAGGGAGRNLRALRGERRACAFTLIELILVMAILTMAVAVTAPALSNFFRGRALDSEARRLLRLTHSGQSRAVSEGIPMDLWLDPQEGTFGLEAEPSYETTDPHAADFKIDPALRIELPKQAANTAAPLNLMRGQVASTASILKVNLTHPNLPTIRFLPDGTVSDTSPSEIRLLGRDGSSLWVAQNKEKNGYEVRSTQE